MLCDYMIFMVFFVLVGIQIWGNDPQLELLSEHKRLTSLNLSGTYQGEPGI